MRGPGLNVSNTPTSTIFKLHQAIASKKLLNISNCLINLCSSSQMNLIIFLNFSKWNASHMTGYIHPSILKGKTSLFGQNPSLSKSKLLQCFQSFRYFVFHSFGTPCVLSSRVIPLPVTAATTHSPPRHPFFRTAANIGSRVAKFWTWQPPKNTCWNSGFGDKLWFRMIWIFAFFSKASLSLTLFFAEEKHRCVVFFSRLVGVTEEFYHIQLQHNHCIHVRFFDTCLCSTIRGSDMSHQSVIEPDFKFQSSSVTMPLSRLRRCGTLKMPSSSTKKKGAEPEDAGTS